MGVMGVGECVGGVGGCWWVLAGVLVGVTGCFWQLVMKILVNNGIF